MLFSRRQITSGLFCFAAVLLFSQAAYYLWIFQGSFRPPAPGCDGVLAYGGLTMAVFRRPFSGPNSLHRGAVYLSGAPSEIEVIGIKPASSNIPVVLDPNAFTTDQNARHAAAYLRSKGLHHVELVTSWFHMPRALFLTRIYLWGTGVEVDPLWAEPIPEHWWKAGRFWLEGLKFWGSLMRVVLAEFGWETQRHFLEINRAEMSKVRHLGCVGVDLALPEFGSILFGFLNRNSPSIPLSVNRAYGLIRNRHWVHGRVCSVTGFENG